MTRIAHFIASLQYHRYECATDCDTYRTQNCHDDVQFRRNNCKFNISALQPFIVLGKLHGMLLCHLFQLFDSMAGTFFILFRHRSITFRCLRLPALSLSIIHAGFPLSTLINYLAVESIKNPPHRKNNLRNGYALIYYNYKITMNKPALQSHKTPYHASIQEQAAR